MNRLKHISVLLLVIVSIALTGACKGKKRTAGAQAESPEVKANFETAFIDACTHANNGNTELALKQFKKCADMRPSEASVYYEMSRLYEKSGEPAMALQNALKAYQLAPDNKYYAIWYAGRLTASRQYDKAIEILEKIRQNNRKDEQIVKDLDRLYDFKYYTDKRISLWTDYQAQGYKLTTALKLVDLYKAKKDYKSAHQVYEQIKTASPRKYQYYIDDSNLYLEEGDEANANANFEKALEINPNNWRVNFSLYKAYRKKNDKAKAGQFLKQALNDINTSVDDKLKYCAELYRESKTDTTLRYYDNIAATELENLYPDNANARFTSAELFSQGGNSLKALAGYKRASELNPNMYDAWLGAINMAGQQGQYKDMLDYATQALEYFPNVAILYAKSATASNHLKKYKEALEAANSGMRYALDDEARLHLLMQQGAAQMGLQKYDESLKTLEQALTISSAEAELYEHMGNTLFFLGRTDEAVKNWEKARSMGRVSVMLDKKIKERKYYE